MKRNPFKIALLVCFFLTVFLICLATSFLFVNMESTVTLIVFNLLFASLIFPLNGTLPQKTFLLLVGNFVGLCWNYIFNLFAYVGALYFDGFFKTFYVFLGPFLNLVWVVSFWSISLTVLSKSRIRKNEGDKH